MSGENWTFWLMMTNYALGLITVIAVVMVAGAVGWDLLGKKAKETRDIEAIEAEVQAMFRGDPHTLSVPGLGFTMADGGEKIEPHDPQASEKDSRK
ncbi:MAG TPA: hypothetical protein VMB19_08580 [Silvibacterium sp.]|nr:hypothetical protein [Silvibacterium sp.]